MPTSTLARIRRAFRKPPGYIAERAAAELRSRVERVRGPRRAAQFDLASLLQATNASRLDELWNHLAAQPYFACTRRVNPEIYESICPGDRERIFDAADAALRHEVSLLGSGPIQLGQQINWHKDYKSGYTWPIAYFRDIDYNNPNRPSDVKFAWELSRLQWAIPIGQAYLLSGEENYAIAIRELLEQWMAANPYGYGVNWACTME